MPPNNKKKAVAAKKAWANRLNRSNSPNVCVEKDEGKQETLSPAMEPVIETAQLHAESDVDDHGNIDVDMELSINNALQQARTASPSVISVQASKSQNHRHFPESQEIVSVHAWL